MSEDLLKKIDTKLAALLAIAIDQHLRSTPELAKPKERSIDELLSGVGMSARDIAALLGKTERAVHLMLEGSRKAVKSTAKSTSRKGARNS